MSTGTETDLKINRNFVSKLGEPYSNCLKTQDSNIGSYFFNYITNNISKTYSKQLCYSLCLQKYIINSCECSSIFLPVNYENSSYCTSEKSSCMNLAMLKMFYDKHHQNCIEACPLECDFVEIKVTTSYATYPSPYYRKVLSNLSKINTTGISYLDIDRAVLKLNVFYESMTYDKIEEEISLTQEALFATIGGFLGITLGLSISSILEIFELVFNMINVYRENTHEFKNIEEIL